MEGFISFFAAVAGGAAMAFPTFFAVRNVTKLARADGNHFVVNVDGKSFVIDVSSIDDMNIATIDQATQAVEDQAKVSA